MDKTTAIASPSAEGLPSMQIDGRRLLADPEARGWQEDTAAGHKRMEAVVQTRGQFRHGGMAALLSLGLIGATGFFLPDFLSGPAARQWLLLALAVAVAGVAGWLLTGRTTINPSRVMRWRFAAMLWAGCATFLWGGAFGQLLQMPWGESVSLVLAAAALGVAMLLAASAHWLPALLVAWGAMLLGQLLTAPAASADLLIPVLGFDLVMLALGMVLGMAMRETARRTVAERTTRRELAVLKAGLNDQLERFNAEADTRRDMESALREARGAADMAVRAKTEFLATMSHEIRTPLNGILPILEILRESRLDDDQRQFLETAYNSSRHLLRIINDVLDFARAESGRLEIESVEIELRGLVESITDLMGKSAERRGLKLNYKIAEDVPRRVRGDPLRLRQVLTNLISNAIKFTETGEIRVELHKRRASRKEVELVFTVRDTGVGMTRDTQRRLFRAFAQADASTTRKHGGTGLGLVICKRLVELMGGRIGVKSQLGEGSSFWFVLPMRKSAGDVPPARKDLAGLRVMTLMDDPAEASRLSEVLSDWGMSEERADSSVAALGRLQSSAQLGKSWGFDLLLLSHQGSRRGLQALLGEIRGQPALAELKVVAFAPAASLQAEMQNLPGVYLMETPINYKALQRQLHRLFDVEGQRLKSEEDTEALFDSLALDFDLDPAAIEAVTAHPVVRGDTVATALLVEDNPVNLSVARRMLAKLGIGTRVASNGHEALAQLEKEPVDLVLMDCQMPSMDGYEATRRLRAVEEGMDPPRHLPVIAMTANAMSDDRDRCLQAGMDDYLAKPLEFASLRRVLEPWVRLHDGRYNSKGLSFAGKPLHAEPEFELGDVEGLRDGAQASTQTQQDGAPLDEARLTGLRELMEDELPRLIGDYLDTAPVLLNKLDAAVGSGDRKGMARAAHTLKSSSANVCAMRLSGLAEKLEQAARKGRPEVARKIHPALSAEYDRVAIALREQLN
jgi:signal transduction histidine kinase/DNA-binding response OmpR family regulator